MALGTGTDQLVPIFRRIILNFLQLNWNLCKNTNIKFKFSALADLWQLAVVLEVFNFQRTLERQWIELCTLNINSDNKLWTLSFRIEQLLHVHHF
jgi:hypothetical protein